MQRREVILGRRPMAPMRPRRTLAALALAQTLCLAGAWYCTPSDQSCWPTAAEWDTLRERVGGRLEAVSPTLYEECYAAGQEPDLILGAGKGVCMQAHDCAKEFCDDRSTESNLPSHIVEAHTVEDVQAALRFAERHQLAVTVKTTGHSYSGSSTGKDSLMIWMHNFEKFGWLEPLEDSCGVVYPATLKIGGGQTWGEAYAVVGSNYTLLGGGSATVSAAGGWLLGGGLSVFSPSLGLGIDNVLRFEAVLTDGRHVVVDACSYPELFWTLRGGGGGTVGVVTAVHYRLHPVSNVVTVSFFMTPNEELGEADKWNHYYRELVYKWIDFWVEVSPLMDRRWGGYWSLSCLQDGGLHFMGSMADARATFLDRLEAWKLSLGEDNQRFIQWSVAEFPSYYHLRTAENKPESAFDAVSGSKTMFIGNRLIPREWVLAGNGTRAKKVLKHLAVNGFHTFNYLLGGAVADVAGDATAVHPAMRTALWQVETVHYPHGPAMLQYLRDQTQGPEFGVGYNHAAKDEPNWEEAFWGANLARLQQHKQEYDPHHRFNCWHCVGYQGADPTSTARPAALETNASTTVQRVVASAPVVAAAAMVAASAASSKAEHVADLSTCTRSENS